MWDVFISHASEDKEEIARPLAEALEKRGLSIWFDTMALKLGDGLRISIDKGLRESRFGIIILSPAFFRKSWPQYELDGLVTQELSYGKKKILPVWHNVIQSDVMRYSPSLANKLAVSTDLGLAEVVRQILDVVSDTQTPPPVTGITPYPSPQEATNKIAIARALNTYFNMSEMHSLCFDLGLDFDDLPGNTRNSKARELTSYMERRGRLPELINYIRNRRPNTEL